MGGWRTRQGIQPVPKRGPGCHSHLLTPREVHNPQAKTAQAPATVKAAVCSHPAQEPGADKAVLEMPSKCTNRQAETARTGLPTGLGVHSPRELTPLQRQWNAFPRLPYTLPRQAVATTPQAPETAPTQEGQSTEGAREGTRAAREGGPEPV